MRTQTASAEQSPSPDPGRLHSVPAARKTVDLERDGLCIGAATSMAGGGILVDDRPLFDDAKRKFVVFAL